MHHQSLPRLHGLFALLANDVARHASGVVLLRYSFPRLRQARMHAASTGDDNEPAGSTWPCGGGLSVCSTLYHELLDGHQPMYGRRRTGDGRVSSLQIKGPLRAFGILICCFRWIWYLGCTQNGVTGRNHAGVDSYVARRPCGACGVCL